MLSQITQLLSERGTLSIQEISLALNTDASALRPMLDLLEQKGRIEKVELPCKTGCATGCMKSETMTYYKSTVVEL